MGIGGVAGSVSRYLIQNVVVNKIYYCFSDWYIRHKYYWQPNNRVIFGLADRYQWMTQEWRLFLAIGFCGSFTTFSTFAFDNLQLIKDGNYHQLF